ncbi:MAG: carbamoyltransferase HypF [Candidatus Omnitrophica bacterium]|nr:carbamoyltransferase HypF [Candidatus Omnitrophota bacterium]
MVNKDSFQRLKLTIRGAVQGVGFRPFVFRLAQRLGLQGFVCNTAGGVIVEVEGDEPLLRDFLLKISCEAPERAAMASVEPVFIEAVGHRGFEIRESREGAVDTWVSPDIAMCDDCRQEIADPSNRRFAYPFTNCMHCGPRYSMIERLPYDRVNTSMKQFKMCDACQREYDDPLARRFHAQPNACAACGPRVALWDGSGRVLAKDGEAIAAAVAAILDGKIVAVKGIGGFHLLVDAASDTAVMRLRERKRRFAKPLALMFPDLASVKTACVVVPLEERLLISPQAPIVLLRRVAGDVIAASVAPGNPYWGVMLPYSPLHQLLLEGVGRAVVATSGNIAEETICIDAREALKRLEDIADIFLVHDRPILRPVDDSVVRVICDTEQVIRRARGYAPLPVMVDDDMLPALAVGGHLKNAVALARGKDVFISSHIGDLETVPSNEAFQRSIDDMGTLLDIKPEHVVCDAHPDYYSTYYAQGLGIPVVTVQHHQAHVLACMADNGLSAPVLGVSWDGSGYGPDGTVWGGEFFSVNDKDMQRLACFEPFYLPGGEAAVREPRRALLGALFTAMGERIFEDRYRPYLSGFKDEELHLLRQMLVKRVNVPLTSSVGRRFDALAALVGLGHVNQFEGQAAMALEFILPEQVPRDAYSFRISGREAGRPYIIQAPVWDEVLEDMERQKSVAQISAKFHNMLVEVMVWAAQSSGMRHVVLTGGCFQNRYLSEHAVKRLREEGFKPFWHQRIPPNDGGLALGQIMAAHRVRISL